MSEPARSTRGASRTPVVAAVAVTALVVVAGLVYLGTRGADAPDPGKISTASCTFTPAGAASRPVDLPSQAPPEAVTVTIDAAFGKVTLLLNGRDAPCATESFLSLARQKYFDGTSCHRLATGSIKVLQCGDPDGNGSGGPGYSFKDENLKGASYPPGTVAMANSGPDTNGSQFFLVFGDTPLPARYTPFGEITAGLDAVRALAAQGSTPPVDGKPNADASIRTVTVG